MNVDYCPRCGKLYAKNVLGMCHACYKELDKMYEACVEYLRKHRGCDIQQLSAETGVSVKQIIKFIREGRISIMTNPNMTIPCEVCGKDIREGTICESCRSKLNKDIQRMHGEERHREEMQEIERARSTYQIRDDKYRP